MTVTATETIRKEILVGASPEIAFRVFTEAIAKWWPLHKYGIFNEDAETVVFEDRDGWRLIEKAKDGRETEWGEVLDFEVAGRLRFTWHPGRPDDEEPTEVEVTFAADGDGTLVTLVHGGWDRLSEERRAGRVDYDNGWPRVLQRYAALAK